MKKLLLVFSLVLLAGCESNPPANDTMQGPVAQQTAVGDARQRAKAHTELGTRYMDQGRLSVALEEARLAIKSDTGYPLGYNLLAMVDMVLGENVAAEENFQQALRLAPTDPDINNNYGWFLCRTGKQQQSLAYFVSASRSPLYQTPAKPLLSAGICALSIGDDKSAEDYLLRAQRLDPSKLDAQFLLASICYRGGRLEEAKRRLDDLHQATEPTAETTWLALRVERKLGDREAESRYAGQIRRKFKASREFQQLMQGEFE
jgi:type IV pilus assembly protein PilF